MLLSSNFKVLKRVSHNFSPYGFTALFLLSESHLAIHTFPEENKTYIELSSCVEKQFNNFVDNIKKYKIDIIE
jgi:S-adenosylmethionine/arginine decarboxylase-like enzyme